MTNRNKANLFQHSRLFVDDFWNGYESIYKKQKTKMILDLLFA